MHVKLLNKVTLKKRKILNKLIPKLSKSSYAVPEGLKGCRLFNAVDFGKPRIISLVASHELKRLWSFY